MSSLKTKEIVVDVVMEVIVAQRFEVAADYQFDDSEHLKAYHKLMDDYGSDKLNLTGRVYFDEIDSDEVLDLCFVGIGDVNVEECVNNEVESHS